MTEKLQKCRSRDFAKHFVDRWMNENLHGGQSMTQVKNTISDYLDKNFGQWKYVLIIYPPLNGEDWHWTNYDVHRFRHHGHNIVLHFLPPSNSKACKDPAPIEWCSNHKRDTSVKYGFYCTHNNSNAHRWYNWIKNHPEYFGDISALTVFQGKYLDLAGQDVCLKEISIERCSSGSVCKHFVPLIHLGKVISGKSREKRYTMTIIYA